MTLRTSRPSRCACECLILAAGDPTYTGIFLAHCTCSDSSAASFSKTAEDPAPYPQDGSHSVGRERVLMKPMKQMDPDRLRNHIVSTYLSLRFGMGVITFAFPVLVYVAGRYQGYDLQC